MNLSLKNFLTQIDKEQQEAYRKITLFNPQLVKDLSKEQKKYFVKVFYHTRGHFDRLLWIRLINAPGKKEKEQILTYMAEEAGLEDGQNLESHEKLFEKFANYLGVEMNVNVIEEEGNLLFVKEFNKNLIDWFLKNDWRTQCLGFSAYERLDNLDYAFMYEVAKVLVKGDALKFFEVHKMANHFEKVSENLEEDWEQDPEKVKEAFYFIYKNQLKMWKKLSEVTFNFKE